MKAKRIVPCMDIRYGKVVKGVRFENVADVDDPLVLCEYYDSTGADVLVFYDIAVSVEGKAPFFDLIKQVKDKIKTPLMVGGGIKSESDIDRLREIGASFVSINTGAINDPSFIDRASKKYGSGILTLSIDAKLVDGKYKVFTNAGTKDTGMDALNWAKELEGRGAGELVVNSIDTDGVKKGYDLKMLESMLNTVKIPIVASGGAGKKEDFLALFRELPDIDAALGASVFHYKEINIAELKKYLGENGIPVNMEA